MKASAWKSGKFGARTRIAFGLSIGKRNVAKYFDRSSTAVVLELDRRPVKVTVTRTFWGSCPELRSKAIGDWLAGQGIVPWSKGKPPKFELTPLGGNRFRLSL